MSLVEVAEPAAPPKCSVGRLIAELDAADGAVFAKWVASVREAKQRPPRKGDPTWSWLGRQLRGNGYQIQDDTLTRHFSGSCTCPR